MGEVLIGNVRPSLHLPRPAEKESFMNTSERRSFRPVAVSILALALLTSCASVPAYAWNNRGHMMVAAVAYQKLTQAKKDRIDALLALNPDRDNWFDLIPAGTSEARTKMFIFDVQHWIDESFNEAKSTVYKNPPIGPGIGPFTLTQVYRTAARTLAEKRIALAGARLAKILNDELR